MIEQTTQLETGYKGVGGWLLFFCIILIISPTFTVFNLVRSYIKRDDSMITELFGNVTFSNIFAVDVLLSLTIVVLSIYVGIQLLLTKRPIAVSNAKRVLILHLIYGFIIAILPLTVRLYEYNDAMLLIMIFAAILSSHISIDGVYYTVLFSSLLTIVKSSVFFTIWYLYLLKSKRVRATYGLKRELY